MLRDNPRLQVLDGALFMGGLQFVAAETVLPTMMAQLGAPGWVMTMAPLLLLVGFNLPVVFSVHAVGRMARVKPFLLVTCGAQRLLFAGAAACLWLLPEWRTLNLCVVVLTPFACGLIGGASFGAWVRLLTMVVPRDRRASVFAYRYLGAAIIGLGAGAVVKVVLREYPGNSGFALLHLGAFLLHALAFAVFWRIEEPRADAAPDPGPTPRPAGHGFLGSFVEMATVIGHDAQLRRHLLSRLFGCGFFIIAPFLALHALRTLGRSEAYVGTLLGAQMVGYLVGNLAFAHIGDRHGGRRVLKVTTLLFMLVGGMAMTGRSEGVFLAMFLLYGAAVTGYNIGNMTMLTDLAPHGQAHLYSGIMAACAIPGMLGAWLASMLAVRHGGMVPAALMAGTAMAISLVFLLAMREPRHHRHASLAPVGC